MSGPVLPTHHTRFRQCGFDIKATEQRKHLNTEIKNKLTCNNRRHCGLGTFAVNSFCDDKLDRCCRRRRCFLRNLWRCSGTRMCVQLTQSFSIHKGSNLILNYRHWYIFSFFCCVIVVFISSC